MDISAHRPPPHNRERHAGHSRGCCSWARCWVSPEGASRRKFRVSQPGKGVLDSWLWSGTVVEHRVARDMDSTSSVEWNSVGDTAGRSLTYALFKSGKEIVELCPQANNVARTADSDDDRMRAGRRRTGRSYGIWGREMRRISWVAGIAALTSSPRGTRGIAEKPSRLYSRPIWARIAIHPRPP
jgi:hypothetical protein